MRISDWSSDVCSSDLQQAHRQIFARHQRDIMGMKMKGRLPHLFLYARSNGQASLFQKGGIHLHFTRDLAHQAQDSGGQERRRSEERRVGKECVSTCSSRWSR